MDSCPICKKTCTSEGQNPLNTLYLINCSYCGDYYIPDNIDRDNYTDKSKFYKVSSWIREQNDEYHTVPKIDNEKFN